MLDEEHAFKLQAKEEEERLARERDQQIKEVNVAWDDIQAKIDAELAQRLQAKEQEELTDAEMEKIVYTILREKRKFFASIHCSQELTHLEVQEWNPSTYTNSFFTTTITGQDKGKGKMAEPEPVKKLSRKD
uniref:Uncharacterized protein n=1 Tax=Tanacetum cinerariifolium TaxID=118510 RepID=A0A699QAD8_TANCI|nr:hypothetical protein [Tanacetum cinerariifolium]